MNQVRGFNKVLFGLALITASCLASYPAAFAAGAFSITYFEAPWADPAGSGTKAFGINNSREIVGSYYDGSNSVHGFLRDAGGTFSQIEVPGATQTWAETINNSGKIVGGYQDALGDQKGFIYDRATGLYQTYVAPDPATYLTFIDYMNDNGDFSGHFMKTGDPYWRGFSVRSGVFADGSILGTNTGYDYYETDFDTITNNNLMAGHFNDGMTQGFFSGDNGATFNYFDIGGYFDTELERINGKREGVGYLTDTSNAANAVYFKDVSVGSPEYLLLFDPATSPWLDSFAEGINEDGILVGYAGDGSRHTSFIATPSAVPEPSTILLTGAGIAALGFLARRRNRNSR
jgi:hypothetical protein